MFRAVAAIAIITTMCVLSPERDSKNDSDATRSWPPSALSASLDVLTGAAANGTARPTETGGREDAAALLVPVARGAASAGLDHVRKIVIPPPSTHVDMPPLRR